MAAKLQLSLIVTRNPRTEPLINGAVQPEGIDLHITVAHPSEIFWRQLHYAEFDVSEMSLSSLLIAIDRNDDRFVGLPIYTSRGFYHTLALIRTDRGIQTPADLKGKRVGVPEYQQTAALWSRGVLKHEFGVSPQEIEWFMERTADFSHGGATGFQPPPGVRLQQISADTDIGAMMAAGELDATLLYYRERNLIDRSRLDLDQHPRVRTLFPDPVAEGARYYRKTGLFPINHGVVVRRSLLERHPWIAVNLYNAFVEAKEQSLARTRELTDVYYRLGHLSQEQRSTLRQDPFPYGIRANRAVLETIAQYSTEQGLTSRKIGLAEIYAPSTLQL